ncbi:hypothetical protein LYNGBM3L_75850 [Moorena producens 3L]|uniref:Uncharacterized protein n=1 Tax=Moorena producens 3L TaxID=489825 RepID=F4XRF8_9CYAN|nr:hypothetical protein LYNGBM3L_75850 [Moorena producens 3L]OLT65294.1 hypothetical protein BI334_09800 [Moorena producens 3L]
MFPGLSATLREQFYQTVFETHLNTCQYLTLQLLILLLQDHRNVSLSRLAKLFPQPIKYESRVRNIQRFLNLLKLSAKLLWFLTIKQIIKQEVHNYQRIYSAKISTKTLG